MNQAGEEATLGLWTQDAVAGLFLASPQGAGYFLLVAYRISSIGPLRKYQSSRRPVVESIGQRGGVFGLRPQMEKQQRRRKEASRKNGDHNRTRHLLKRTLKAG